MTSKTKAQISRTDYDDDEGIWRQCWNCQVRGRFDIGGNGVNPISEVILR